MQLSSSAAAAGASPAGVTPSGASAGVDAVTCRPGLTAASAAGGSADVHRGSSPLHAARHLIEPDPNSVASDYSELGESIREHLASVQIIGREDLDLGNTVPPASARVDEDDAAAAAAAQSGGGQHLQRTDDETDEQFARRIRKTNYLSLAQEFAELKRLNADALPFDLHRGQFQTSPGLSSDDDYDADLDALDDGSGPSERLHLDEEEGTLESYSVEEQEPSERLYLDEVEAPPGRYFSEGQGPASERLYVEDLVATTDCGPSDNDAVAVHAVPDLIQSQHDVDDVTRAALPVQRGTSPAGCRHHNGQTVDPVAQSGSAVSAGTDGQTAAAAGADEFDVYTIETALPHVEWERIEESLRQSAYEDKKRSWSRHSNHRDEIRRRLAMSADDDLYSDDFDVAVRRSQQSTGRSGMHCSTSLQVCYVNDVAADLDRDLAAAAAGCTSTSATVQQQHHPKPDVIPKSISEASTLSSVACKLGDSVHEDFFTKQARLQAEAKLALAQVRPMAHMQVQIEREMRKKSPLSETVVGIPGFVDGKFRQLSRQLLYRMNIAQLQVVVNDLHTQIEALNGYLMQQLVDRDDLHMAQDSMLVDIDDLTRRAQEFAAKINKRNSTAADAGCR